MSDNRIPADNNVYGEIKTKRLKPVLRVFQDLFGDGKVSMYRSQFNGAESLEVCTDPADFETTAVDGTNDHLISGAVAGSADEVVHLVENMSRVLVAANVKHRFEVYDADQILMRTIAYGVWP